MEAGFRRVAIVGVGLIGGSLGMALKNRRLAASVVGIGRDRERLEKARALGAVDAIALDLAEGVRGVAQLPVGAVVLEMENPFQCGL